MAAVSIKIHGGEVLIDEADEHFFEGQKWCVKIGTSGIKYAYSRYGRLHRLILGAAKGEIVDHINGNGLDNRRDNLRICSHAQNSQNQRPIYAKSSAYKGVSAVKRKSPYTAHITAFGERLYLGSFADERAAALAYDQAARKYHGEFARTNASLGLL